MRTVQYLAGCVTIVTLLQLTTATSLALSNSEDPDQKYETCQTETFQAECAKDEVIVMTTARYGRMELGRCVKQSLGYLGCYSDVLGILDAMCSGRRRCSVRVPDPLLDATNPCLEELKAYLEASYSCVQVIAPMNTCDGNPVKLARPEGYLSSYIALTTSCGLEQSPWILQAHPGQRINITFYEFRPHITNGPVLFANTPQTQCEEYAFIMDKSSGQKLKLCPGGRRVSAAYTSVNNSLEVTLRALRVREDASHFLIYYKFVGCADLSVANDLEFERTSDVTAVLTCTDTDQSFDLICDGNTWKGQTGNCSEVHVIHGQTETKSTMMDGLVMVCLIGISLIIISILIGTIVICVKRMNRRPDRLFYQYNANAPYHQQENRANIKQLHIDNQNIEMRNHDAIYRPLMSANHVNTAPKQPQSECLLCNAHTQERSYDLAQEHYRTYAPRKNPRVFNNYSLKQSNIRNNLSLKLHRKPKYEHGCQNMSTHVQNNYQDGRGVERTKQLNKSVDCDMMLDYKCEAEVSKKAVTHYPAATIANSSVLNNTL